MTAPRARKWQSWDSNPGPLLPSHALPLMTGAREPDPSITGRDPETQSHQPHMVRRLQQQQPPLSQETQIQNATPDQRPQDTAALITPTIPQCYTVTCAVHSHPVSHRPRRYLSCSHGHGTPRPFPQATLRSVPLSSTLPVRSLLPSTPLPLQLHSAHRTPLLTPPPFTPWCWGKGAQPWD